MRRTVEGDRIIREVERGERQQQVARAVRIATTTAAIGLVLIVAVIVAA